MRKIINWLGAKYRAFALVSCLESPRPDIFRGFSRWRWLYRRRRSGALIDPSIEIRSNAKNPDELEKILEIEDGVALDKGVILWADENNGSLGRVRIRKRAYVGPYTFLGSCHNLEIGENAMLGAHSYLITANHSTSKREVSYNSQGYEGADIVLGDNVWLGCHVVVLPGVKIGNDAIIGAGAVVTKDVPAGETWAGVPARKIKEAE